MEPLLAPKDAADSLRVSVDTLLAFVQAGEHKFINVGQGKQRIASMRVLSVAACLFLLAPSLLARPRQQPQQQDVMESMALERGKCRTLITLQSDKSARCTDKLINTTWRSGRAGFYFMTDDNEAITFSGMGDGQIHPNPDVAIQPVDKIIFGKTHEVQKAVGSCRFTNPFHGKATVDCEAITEVGPFKGSFETDGTEPDIKRF